MDYQLELTFSHEDLAYLNGVGQHIAIAKAVDGKMSNVVWVGVEPAPTSILTWKEEYGLYYADRSDLPSGVTLTQSDNCIARDDEPY